MDRFHEYFVGLLCKRNILQGFTMKWKQWLLAKSSRLSLAEIGNFYFLFQLHCIFSFVFIGLYSFIKKEDNVFSKIL